ncbi:MAG: PadR family transcriptional regulator [Acidimicrobiia bacterium]|nr:PadR family transcriptional regulator [Acidimicrobiia bacterium]
MGKKLDLLPGTLDVLILKTLSRNRAMHGYGIAESLAEATEGVFDVDEGSLYPALQRLLLDGYVEAEWGRSENNRRARYYKLTADGRRHLHREQAQFHRLMEAMLRVLRPA